MTPVMFRRWRDGGIIALFPEIPADLTGGVMAYEHVGQHGAADYSLVMARTVPARPGDYADLLRELAEPVGYDDLRVYRRRTRHMADSYRAEVRRLTA